YDLSVNIRQPEIASRVAISKFFVVEAQKLQDRGMQIMDVNYVFHCLEPKFIRGSMDSPALHPTASQPDGEAIRVMVTAIFGNSGIIELYRWSPSEFPTKDN